MPFKIDQAIEKERNDNIYGRVIEFCKKMKDGDGVDSHELAKELGACYGTIKSMGTNPRLDEYRFKIESNRSYIYCNKKTAAKYKRK